MTDGGREIRQHDPSRYVRERQAVTEHGQSRNLEYPPQPEALVVPVYDNHAHLEISDGDPDGEQLDYRDHLDRASAVGVRGAVQVGGDLDTSRWTADVVAREPRLLGAVAIHPNEAPGYAASGLLDDALAEIHELAGRTRVRAIGETGLDYFRTAEGGRAAQQKSFEAHIEIAKERGIAMQIHDRDAHREVVDTLLRVGAPDRTVFHCFSGDAELAEICTEHGWYMSFAGTVTFKNSLGIRDALEVAPRSLLLVETDTPFLTPHPFRGRPNSPYMIPHTMRAMANYLQTDVSMLAAQITSNTEAVYGTWDSEPVTVPE
jgi:TatD DNase family protein